jgi:hypothetical protein
MTLFLNEAATTAATTVWSMYGKRLAKKEVPVLTVVETLLPVLLPVSELPSFFDITKRKKARILLKALAALAVTWVLVR